MSFAEDPLAGLTKNGLLSAVMAMGQRTGLFDVILGASLPMTAAEVASKAKLRKRYVKEWLVCMAMWGILDMDSPTSKYSMAESNKHILRAILRQISIISAVIQRFESVAKCFQLDGPSGVPFEAEGGLNFLEQLGENESTSVSEVIELDYLPHIPDLKKKLEFGIEVAEFGSNAGATIIRLAQIFPASRFRGSDVVESVVNDANKRIRQLGLSNITFDLVDMCNIPPSWVNAFDWVFVRDVIHDLPHPVRGVENMTSALRKGGLCSVLDINAASDPARNIGQTGMDVLSTLSLFFCVPHALHGNPESPALGTLYGIEKGKELFTSTGMTLLFCNPANFAPDLFHYVLKK